MIRTTSNNDVITALRLKAKELLRDIERYEVLISNNRDIVESLNKSIIALGGNIDESNTTAVGITFKDRVVNIFEDGRPRTSRQVYNDFMKIVPNTNIKSFYDFSGRFANILKPAGIKKHKVPENPIHKRFYYGLIDWFNQDKLKDEYIMKIISQ